VIVTDDLDLQPNQDSLSFLCPKDGKISQGDVNFLCNKCSAEKVIYKDGVYVCPECLLNQPGNFQCRICGSESVEPLWTNKEKEKFKQVTR
jgi:hypothetical protein